MSCGYQGSHFGAYYEDACCIDGYLWDLDSCDEPGGCLSVGGDVPCPSCNTNKYVSYYLVFPGNSHQRRKAIRKAARKVRYDLKGGA